jgi:hypothetical protein
VASFVDHSKSLKGFIPKTREERRATAWSPRDLLPGWLVACWQSRGGLAAAQTEAEGGLGKASPGDTSSRGGDGSLEDQPPGSKAEGRENEAEMEVPFSAR